MFKPFFPSHLTCSLSFISPFLKSKESRLQRRIVDYIRNNFIVYDDFMCHPGSKFNSFALSFRSHVWRSMYRTVLTKFMPGLCWTRRNETLLSMTSYKGVRNRHSVAILICGHSLTSPEVGLSNILYSWETSRKRWVLVLTNDYDLYQ